MDNSVTGHDLSVGYGHNEVLLVVLICHLSLVKSWRLTEPLGWQNNSFANRRSPDPRESNQYFRQGKAKHCEIGYIPQRLGLIRHAVFTQCHAGRYSRPHICLTHGACKIHTLEAIESKVNAQTPDSN